MPDRLAALFTTLYLEIQLYQHRMEQIVKRLSPAAADAVATRCRQFVYTSQNSHVLDKMRQRLRQTGWTDRVHSATLIFHLR